ncbi:hypothetical protein DFH29DRAFT_1081507 [Suillus ampliporus]|nr:hypothetical protein DFH29DRAFT_1081507 [Suillus ampliporus]
MVWHVFCLPDGVSLAAAMYKNWRPSARSIRKMSASTPQSSMAPPNHGPTHSPPTLHSTQGNLGHSTIERSSNPVMGSNFYSSSYASLQTLNLIDHNSLASSRYFGTVPDMPFADPMMLSPNAVSRTSYNPSTVLYYGSPHNPPTLDDLGGFGRSGSLARGSNYSSPYASQTQNLNDHTLHPPVSSQHTVADSDNAEPGMFTYDLSSHQWQNFFIPQPPPSQSQLLASQSYSIPAQNHTSSPLFICHWLPIFLSAEMRGFDAAGMVVIITSVVIPQFMSCGAAASGVISMKSI